MSNGLLNAANETELTAGIRLTDGKINLPNLTRDFVNTTISKIAVFEEYAKNHSRERYETKKLLEDFPEIETTFAFMEVGTHESIHAIQKHSYRSVYSLVDAMQSIENWELKLFISHAINGGTWKAGESFLSCLETLVSKEPSMIGIADYITQNCETVIRAAAPNESGLSLLHLIEGQAFIAARLAVHTLDVLPFPSREIYTKAWDSYKKAGGKEALIFTLIVGAALRYGNIETDSDDSSFRSFYPHPVDIFEYLLNFVSEFEQICKEMDTEQPTQLRHWLALNDLSINNAMAEILDNKNSNFFNRIRNAVLDKSDKGINPKDSNIEWLSYLQCKITDDSNNEERIQMSKKHHNNIFCVFEKVDEQYTVSDECNEVINRLLVISKLIATAVETAYSRVAEPMNEEFPKAGNKNIADAVGSYVAAIIPDYYKEETFIRLLVDQDFVLGKLFGVFLNGISEEVFVKPYAHMPEMTHADYLSMTLLPDLIKKILAVVNWKKQIITYAPPLPYCCSAHGIVSFNEARPDFFDKCTNEDAVGRAFNIMFSRPVSSFFSN